MATSSTVPGDSMWSESTLAGTSTRPAILQLRIESDQELYQAYIPSFQGGGLFVPTSRPYQLGDELYGLLSIGDDAQRHPLVGKVAWVTPANHAATRQRGVGIRFPDDERGQKLKKLIEDRLGNALHSGRANHTF